MAYFKVSLFFIIGITCYLLLFIFIVLRVKRRRKVKYLEWEELINLAINTAIFSDEEEVITLPKDCALLLSNTRFRKLLTAKIISISKDLSGHSVVNLKRLYAQLALERYAASSLKSSHWHIRAKCIQEIGVMGLKDRLDEVYKHTEDKNELIRIEAQVSVIKLIGFSGLDFLDTIPYKISEWDQIILLRELSLLPPDDLKGANKWLKSENKSVVTFALRLAGNYHRFSLYDEIEKCLYHHDQEIRFQAIKTLTKVYNGGTSEKLKEIFTEEVVENKRELIKALKVIGTEEDIPFLLDILSFLDNELKLMVIDAIATISADGLARLQSFAEAKEYPLNEMILHVNENIKR